MNETGPWTNEELEGAWKASMEMSRRQIKVAAELRKERDRLKLSNAQLVDAVQSLLRLHVNDGTSPAGGAVDRAKAALRRATEVTK